MAVRHLPTSENQQAKASIRERLHARMVEKIIIINKKFTTTLVTYAIKDVADEDIKGRFYEPELQLITKKDTVYDVEKVLKTRRRNDIIECYVKWKGYPDKFNSWIDSCSLVSANVGSSAVLNSRKRDNLFLPSPYGLNRRDCECSQLVYKRYKYLPVVVTRKRKRQLSTSESIDKEEKRKWRHFIRFYHRTAAWRLTQIIS